MRSRHLKKQLADYQLPEIKNEKVQETLILAQQLYEKKGIFVRQTFCEMFRGQLGYISPLFWGIQLIALMGMVTILWLTVREELSKSMVCVFLSAGTPLLVLTGIPELTKSEIYGMWEIEQCCRCNLQKLWAIRMVLIGGTDLFILTVLYLFTALAYDIPLLFLGLYMLVPFQICAVICLAIIRKGHSRHIAIWTTAAVTFVVAVSFVVLSEYPYVYYRTAVWIWALLFFLSLIFFVREIWESFQHKKLRECYQWN